MGSRDPNLEYVSINRENWNERAEVHSRSKWYKFAAFQDPAYISNIVKFDQKMLPTIRDKHIIHLQGHIGTDSLSLARLGAASVTILDFSHTSLAVAQRLADSCKSSGGDKLHFVEANVYDAADPALYTGATPKPGEFDMVFTGIGALCWLHSIADWANVVSQLLRPGGELFIRDGHPMLYAIDDAAAHDGVLPLGYSYFEQEEGTLLEGGGTYTDSVDSTTSEFKAKKTVEFNHGIGEMVQAVIDAGMRLTKLKEHMEMPWEAIPGQMEQVDVGTGVDEWRIKDRPSRCPHTFTLVAKKE